MHTFKVKFYLRPEPNKDGNHSIQARIYLNHERDYLSCTKVAVPQKSWNVRLEKVASNTPEGHLMNHRLDNLRRQITDIYQQNKDNEHLSVGFIKETYLAMVKEKSGKEGVCTFFKKYIEENKETMTQDYHRRIVKVSNLFGQYVKYAYNTDDIDFADIDHKMLDEFESYLLFDEGYTHARTLKNKIGVLKTLLGAAHELDMMEQDPFDGYESRSLFPPKAEFLTIEEVKRLKGATFDTKRLEKVRDCFLFSCYTGLSYQELRSLTKKDLTRLNSSTWILLKGETEDSPRYIPLLSYAATIIKKYSTDDEQAQLLPLISHQKTNLYLKEIAKVCEIDKTLTFQTAVQSFMKIALTAGASIDSVSHMLGKPLHHATPFARFSPERIEDEMAMFAARMGRDRPIDNDN